MTAKERRSGWRRARKGGRAALLVGAAFALGWLARTALAPAVPPPAAPGTIAGAADVPGTFWTCAMHPQVRLPEPGRCPICAMELIQVSAGAAEDREVPRLVLSEADRARLRIRTTRVERRPVETTVRMSGKLDYDETRIETITARAAGRIDRLYVDYTGVEVKRGDHLVELFSPKLYAAQEELLQALGAARGAGAGPEGEGARVVLDAARERLRQLGLTGAQIADVEERGTPTDVMTIYAPQGGIVLRKYVQRGTYLTEGARLFEIADLEHLWVKLDAYESDLAWLRYGQTVEFVTEAFPGETFHGTISFIDPILDDRTRTVKVRVNVDNSDRRLKPNMFVKAVVRPRVGEGGRVLDPNLAGRWICPMHPEIVREHRGTCDLCGMDLVTTESRGYAAVDEDRGAPLVVPATAVLLTGQRAVVYVEVPDAERPTYEGREVVLGPRAGAWYLVASGLAEGERVVTNGNFKIDSALQIQARPSMMSHEPAPGTDEIADPLRLRSATAPPGLHETLAAAYGAYLDLQSALAADDLAAARAAVAPVRGTLAALLAIEVGAEGPTASALAAVAVPGERALEALAGAGDRDMEGLRELFAPLSEALILAFDAFGLPGAEAHELECPMVDSTGGRWIQDTAVVHNPYFGEAMPGCGSVVRTLVGPEDR